MFVYFTGINSVKVRGKYGKLNYWLALVKATGK
jgi:hypothetical protein